MADVMRVAEVLATHQPSHVVNSTNSTYLCLCDAAIPVPGGFDGDAYAIDWEAMMRAVCAHQAQMLADAGLVASETEWGCLDPDHPESSVIVCDTEARARHIAEPYDNEPNVWDVVRREVTPWRPADEGGESRD